MWPLKHNSEGKERKGKGGEGGLRRRNDAGLRELNIMACLDNLKFTRKSCLQKTFMGAIS